MASISAEEATAGPSYEAPAVVAAFPREALEQELPENLNPHIHAVQNS